MGEGVRVRKRLEDAMKMEKGPQANEHRRPLEVEMGKGTDYPLEPSEKMQPC